MASLQVLIKELFNEVKRNNESSTKNRLQNLGLMQIAIRLAIQFSFQCHSALAV